MTDATDFYAKYRAHQAHKAAVPAALALARELVIDFNGQPMVDGEPPRDGLTCSHLRTLIAEVDRLTALVSQMHKDAAENEREFAREARDIAAEARWDERERMGSDPYGY